MYETTDYFYTLHLLNFHILQYAHIIASLNQSEAVNGLVGTEELTSALRLDAHLRTITSDAPPGA